MFTLIRSLSTRQLVVEQLPIFLISLFIAETFYKFGSFLLESIAFLVTWFVVDLAASLVRRLLFPPSANQEHLGRR